MKNCSLKDFLNLFTSQNQLNDKTQGRCTSVLSPAMAPNMLVLEIVPRLPQEQANTISRIKQNEIGF